MTDHVLSRDEILTAIREMTEESGTPPGRRTFVARYRVPPSAFGGMYWARWSDAVRDAGLVPLEPLSEISEDFILEALAKLTLELGRYPTQGEMKVLKLTQPEFPGVPAISKRLGSRPEQTSRLSAWCERNREYQAVCDVLRSELVEYRDEGSRLIEAETGVVSGFVYMLQRGREYKIGLTEGSVGKRWHEVDKGSDRRSTHVHSYRTDDVFGVEKYWHARFAEFRREHEWFELQPAHIKAFKRRKDLGS